MRSCYQGSATGTVHVVLGLACSAAMLAVMSSAAPPCLPRLSSQLTLGTAYGSPSPGVNSSVVTAANALYEQSVVLGGKIVQIGMPWVRLDMDL